MRVGALPKFPSNALNYNLTWSTDGVINEYCEPCEAIVNGQLRETQPLEELEEFSLDGILYEAFNTSGGLGTLCETLAGKVRNLNYRTIRYPGHAAIMKALLNDLRLRDRRELLKDILENAVPITLQDVVIVFVTVSGMRGGQLMQETYANKIYAAPLGGRVRSAIQITTAGGICAVLDMLKRRRTAPVRSHPPGADRPQGLPRQPLRPMLRNGDAGDSGIRAGEFLTNAAMSASVGDRPRASLARAATVSACARFGYSFRVTEAPQALKAAAKFCEFFGAHLRVVQAVHQQHGRRAGAHEIDGLRLRVVLRRPKHVLHVRLEQRQEIVGSRQADHAGNMRLTARPAAAK